MKGNGSAKVKFLNFKFFFIGIFLLIQPAYARATCTQEYIPARGPQKKDNIHKGLPFAPGEVATYDVYYMGLMVGKGSLFVHEPLYYKDHWHRVFAVKAQTGDWYSAIFVAKEFAKAHSRASDFAIQWFRLSQDEGSLFGSRFRQDKVLQFDHENCKVVESVKRADKPMVKEEVELEAGAADALGVVYKLRMTPFSIGKKVKVLVYSSQKNWWLEAEPLALEKITVPAGTFETVKIKLQTFLGKELQQKGDVHIWMATKHPNRPLVKITGEIKIGSVNMVLQAFKAGTP